jgi:hypothetical protein
MDIVDTPAPSRAARRPGAPSGAIRTGLETVLFRYEQARAAEAFGRDHPLWDTFLVLRDALARLPAVAGRPSLRVSWSAGGGRWARVPWVALLDERETRTPRRGVHAAFLFRQDLSGVYLVLAQGIAEPARQLGRSVARATLKRRGADLRAFARELPARGFRLDDLIDLRTDDAGLGRDHEAAVVAHKLYEAGAVPGDEALAADLDALLRAYERYVRARRARVIAPAPEREPFHPPRRTRRPPAGTAWEPGKAVAGLVEYVRRRRFVFEPWQVAAYVAALRTKPFAILAGVSGTGKSRLPALVAEGTGGVSRLVPVRPDWTDSAETLGYTDLSGRFRPGAVLRLAREAAEHTSRGHVCILDEMNLARPEHFFAEVLSHVEDRRPHPGGGFAGGALLPSPADEEWSTVGLPPNLALVGTVNMDESAHGFSRKVLDRAFTLELSDVDLARWEAEEGDGAEPPAPARWPASAWYPRALTLGTLPTPSPAERARIKETVDALCAANAHLAPAGVQAGYRSRDEMALFVLHAGETPECFTTRAGEPVDPLDLALHMKLLPRLAGGSAAVRRAVLGLLGWAADGVPLRAEEGARARLDAWERAGRPGALPDARFPRTAARLCLMWERMLAEGFTSFWA